MRTFTYSDAKSHKFWNIELKGKSFTVAFGRQGTGGQTQTKSFPDEAKARKEHDKLVKEKLAKGYTETTPAAKPAASSAREALERALVESPDDLAAHAAYADLLVEEGDPRGEFIQVQLALEDPKKSPAQREKLQQQEKKLLRKYKSEWLGDLAPVLQEGSKRKRWDDFTLRCQYRFARGWLDTLSVSNFTVAFSRLLARAPQIRLLRHLTLDEEAYEQPDEYEAGDDVPKGAYSPALYPLLRSPYLGNVRIFQLGEQVSAADEEEALDGAISCHTEGEAAVGLVKLMPRLEELYLLAHNVDTGQLFRMKTLHTLRVLQVYHNNSYPLHHLAGNPSLGRLTHLLCHPHSAEEEDAYIRLPGVRALVQSKNLPALTHLRLRMSDMGDKGVAEIVNSGILKRLKMLDLRHGCITDKGGRLLADCPDLRNLELLDLTGNSLTPDGVKALEATGVRLVADQQWDPAEVDPYDEGGYLYAGDIE